jgi:ubiquinone/menaquinone biosynthesis C-methylase UbiE
VTPPARHPDPVANPFAASGVGARYDRGRPFHHPRSLERILAIVGAAPVEHALDIACGTGMSTVALAAYASTVVGVDRSPEMLRAARRADGLDYLLASAERMPFVPQSFGAATCCSAVHWFDQEAFFGELHRVLGPSGWIGLYDHYFIGEMVDVPEFADWCRDSLQRYPLPPRNPQVGDPRSLEPAGFEKLGDELFADDIEMTHAELVDYQLTISNFVDAAERGTSRDEIEAWALASTAPMFAGVATRTVRFLGSITCFRRDG